MLVWAELEWLLKVGFIQLVEITNSVSPMVLVKFLNGKMRLCIDYRKTNAYTQKHHFFLPFILFLWKEGGGHAIYIFMNRYAGYNQIFIAPGDLHKTAFTTP